MYRYFPKSLLAATTAAATTALLVSTPLVQAQENKSDGKVTRAVALLQPTEGSKTKGLITFEQTDAGMKVTGKIEGLTPGPHGFHVHEFGDLTSPDGTAAGGHFNPTGHPHAGMDAEERHVGDLGNVEADDKGVANIDLTDKHLKFDGKASILGRGLVVHAKADDLKSQPSGDAGDRAAVGVIGVAKAADQ